CNTRLEPYRLCSCWALIQSKAALSLALRIQAVTLPDSRHLSPRWEANGLRCSRRLHLASCGSDSSLTQRRSPPLRHSCVQSKRLLRRLGSSRSRPPFTASLRSKTRWRRLGASLEGASS